jgi:hypothetical protein
MNGWEEINHQPHEGAIALFYSCLFEGLLLGDLGRLQSDTNILVAYLDIFMFLELNCSVLRF